MSSLLKALGLTIWSLIAIGFVAVVSFVGYQSAIKQRLRPALDVEPVAESMVPPKIASRSEPLSEVPSTNPKLGVVPSTLQNESPSTISVPTADVFRAMLQSAAARHQHAFVIQYGQELLDSGQASANDMVSVAQSYASIEDCVNARAWLERAANALQSKGEELTEAQRQTTQNCRQRSRVFIDPSRLERTNRLLRALRQRADADRKRLPQLESEAAASTSGNPSVMLGELYYGFGSYGKAIESIERGLDRGEVKHLEDAYVYLGLSLQAVGDVEGARDAFARLKDVPGISPRVLKLWTLYAEAEL